MAQKNDDRKEKKKVVETVGIQSSQTYGRKPSIGVEETVKGKEKVTITPTNKL